MFFWSSPNGGGSLILAVVLSAVPHVLVSFIFTLVSTAEVENCQSQRPLRDSSVCFISYLIGDSQLGQSVSLCQGHVTPATSQGCPHTVAAVHRRHQHLHCPLDRRAVHLTGNHRGSRNETQILRYRLLDHRPDRSGNLARLCCVRYSDSPQPEEADESARLTQSLWHGDRLRCHVHSGMRCTAHHNSGSTSLS